jgi:hypothetical protein
MGLPGAKVKVGFVLQMPSERPMKILSAADGWTVVPALFELALPLADPLETSVEPWYQDQVAVHESW